MDCIIGVDFDNTIVSYDKLIFTIALERGFISKNIRRNKKAIRDSIRQLPNGEEEWQRLQAILYGSMMGEATMARGIKTFFKLGKRNKASIYIISHKTEYAVFDESRTNLRAAAMEWMKTHRFFEKKGLGLSTQDVFFASNRQEKIRHIRQLRCRYFIDDLEETFLEDSFPINVEKILYTPSTSISHSPAGDVRSFRTWKDISKYVFGTIR